MTQALYRKYRSRSFKEVVGQEHITEILRKALERGRISHAYLFTGPRGVGKTSMARILAYEVNSLPYNEYLHLDIIEIDAASNRRIDEIRDLRERVHITPTSAKYKVYIIDEVHMLTREAFNALLKTLEEPPQHCIFILVTTEAHKLPATIISRTQHFNFKPINPNQLSNHLGEIANKEKIDISSVALDLLAEYGEGSFRDSISLLDQLSSLRQQITEQTVRDFLGLPPARSIKQIINSIKDGDSRNIIKILNELAHQGSNPVTVAHLIAQELRSHLIKEAKSTWQIMLLRQLIDVMASSRPHDSLEISLLEAAGQSLSPKRFIDQQAEPSRDSEDKKIKDNTKDESVNSQQMSSRDLKKSNQPDEQISPNPTISVSQRSFDLSMWPEILNIIRTQTPALYTALRLARPELSENILTLVFQFPLHQKKVNQAKQLHLVEKIIAKQSNSKIIIHSIVDKQLYSRVGADPIQKDISNEKLGSGSPDPLEAISNIFGAAEVLES